MIRKQKDDDGINSENNTSRIPMDKKRIVEAALTLLNNEGIDQLSMRRLADTLGIRAASLYWHVKDKAELIQLLADKICEMISLPDPSLSWQQQILLITRDYRNVLLSIRDSVNILLDSTPATPKRFELIEAVYRVLASGGLSPEEVAFAASLINNYVLSFVADEMRFVKAAQVEGKSVEEMASYVRQMFLSSPDKYPTMFHLADYATNPDMDKQFQFGLQVLLDGLTARLKK